MPLLGSRFLLFSGTLYKVKSKKELVVFLFNDILVLSQPTNVTAVSLPSGNITLPVKPDTSLKWCFRAYRKPISTASVSVDFFLI